MKTFAITTLGCRVNQSESEALKEKLEGSGLSKNPPETTADICVINTCAVTSKAAMQSRQAVRRMIRSHPRACIIVTGCNAQIAFDEMAAIPGVHAVIRQPEKERIPEILLDLTREKHLVSRSPMQYQAEFKSTDVSQNPGLNGRARPYLKIQDGCNGRCTYCIVPRARGQSRSMFPDAVWENLLRLEAKGYPETVLTGIHLGSYGCDLEKPTNLLDLLLEIETLQVMDRIRLSSLEPNEVSDALIECIAASQMKKPRICPHFHLPLQSGDDEILKRMGRPYDGDLYRDRVEKILSAMPDAAIGADVMVAFPGETESSFERTLTFIDSLPLAYMHVFPFSPRPGTPAFRYEGRVDPQTAKMRCKRLRELSRAKKAKFYSAAVGKQVELVMENGALRRKGHYRGISEAYIPVWIKSDAMPTGRKVRARISHLDATLSVFGTAV